MITEIGIGLAMAPVVLGGYAYIGYPAVLKMIARRRRHWDDKRAADWPTVSIVVPVYNEARVLGRTLEQALALDYPRDRLQILVVSDASTDGTDEIARSFRDRGVELLRMPERRGKTAAENAAGASVFGEVVVNIDASVRVPRESLRLLVRPFMDPEVGVASSRNVPLDAETSASTKGEESYMDYEMRVRSLETRVSSIVGASGCFFATRRALYKLPFPEQLSRDFGSALIARLHGYRAVEVDEAICYVPCTTSLRAERRRKLRTMTRGLGTLWHMRQLLDPVRYGLFSWMLFSHKLARWLVPLSIPFAIAGLGLLATLSETEAVALTARVALIATAAGAGVGWMGMAMSDRGKLPRLLALPAFALGAVVAGTQAWARWLIGESVPLWEPTRRALRNDASARA